MVCVACLLCQENRRLSSPPLSRGSQPSCCINLYLVLAFLGRAAQPEFCLYIVLGQTLFSQKCSTSLMLNVMIVWTVCGFRGYRYSSKYLLLFFSFVVLTSCCYVQISVILQQGMQNSCIQSTGKKYCCLYSSETYNTLATYSKH